MKTIQTRPNTDKFLAVIMIFAGLAVSCAQAALYPDMPVHEPTTNYPSHFSRFDPPVSFGAEPLEGAPEVYEYTRDNNAGETMIMTGGNFTLYTNSACSDEVEISSAILNDSFADTFSLQSSWTSTTKIEIRCSAYEVPKNSARMFYAVENGKEATIYYQDGKWMASDGAGGHTIIGNFDQEPHTFIYDSLLGFASLDGHSIPLTGKINDGSTLYVACNSTGYQDYPMIVDSLRVWQDGILVEDLVPAIDGHFVNRVDGTTYQSKDKDSITSQPVPFELNADRRIAYSGEEGQDTSFIAYGAGVDGACEIVRMADSCVAISLPKVLPRDEVYLVWAGNALGYGLPVAVNAAEAWWIGPNTLHPDEEFSIYGRNLGTNCYAYIEEMDLWIPSSSSNPYKADFKMPESIAAGSYTLRVHNTHGRKYGWSMPLVCAVESVFSWSGKTINVKTFGAKGDGFTDDWEAVKSAVASSSVGDTIYFPAGTYALSYRFSGMSDRRFVGDGMDKTIVTPHSSHSQKGMLFDGIFKNFIVLDMGFETAATGSSLFRFQGRNSLFERVGMSSLAQGSGSTTTPFIFQNTIGHRFKDCRIINSGNPGNLSVSGSRQVFFEGCDFYGANHCSIVIGSWGGQMISVEQCSLQPYDASETGYFDGRWFVTADYWGAVNRIYFGENTSTDCAPPKIDGYHANTGEQVLIEGGRFRLRGSVESATPNTVSLDEIGDLDIKLVVTVVAGKGYGQTRKVASVDSAANTIYLQEPWRVVPDQSSVVVVAATTYRFAVYNNHLDGKAEWATGDIKSASTGVASFGGSIDLVVDGNKMTDLRTGIYHWPLGGQEVDGIRSLQTCFFNTFINNSFSNGNVGLLNIVNETDQDLKLDGGILAATYRGNLTESMSGDGVLYATSLPEYLIRMSVYENNIFNTCASAITDAPYVENQLFLGNRGTNQNVGVALTISYNHLPVIKDNRWTGYAEDYGIGPSTERPPEQLLEVPFRVVDMSEMSEIPVWNLARSPLTWAATTDDKWLVLESNQKTIADQNDDQASLEFAINQEELPSGGGMVTGRVEVAAGDQIRIVTVIYASGSEPGDSETGNSVVYPLDGFEGTTIRVFIEGTNNWQRYIGEFENPTQIRIDDMDQGVWDKIIVKQYDGELGRWESVHEIWRR